MEEVLVPAILFSIENRLSDNAVFLAERLHAASNSSTSLHYLAKAYLARHKPQHAFRILAAAKPSSLVSNAPHNRYLYAQCCYELNKLHEAEWVLLTAAAGAAPE